MSHNITIYETSNSITVIEQNVVNNLTIEEGSEETVVTVYRDGSIGVATIGIQGPQGETGPIGPSVNITESGALNIPAPVTLSPLTAVRTDFYPCTSSSSHAFYGVTVAGIAEGETGPIYTLGEVDTPGTNWQQGSSVYIGSDGVLTQTRPSGYLHRIGYAVSQTRIRIYPNPVVVKLAD